MNNEAEYQRQRGDNWKSYTQVAVPVLAGATVLTAIGAGISGFRLHKRRAKKMLKINDI